MHRYLPLLTLTEAHGKAAHAAQFRDKLGPMSGALYDERLYRALD